MYYGESSFRFSFLVQAFFKYSTELSIKIKRNPSKFNKKMNYIDELQSPTKVVAHVAISVREFISLSPSPQFNVVYRDEGFIARLQHCWANGVVYSSDANRYCSLITLSAYFRAI